MKNKGMLTKISCITLAGLITLSGHTFASEIRDNAIDKIQTDSSATSLLTDKVLGYGSNYDLRLYEYLEAQDPGSTNAAWALVAQQLLELKTGVTYSAKHMDYATAYNSTNEGTPNAHNRYLGQGGNRLVALGYLTSGRGVVTSNDFAWDGNINKVSLSTLNSKTLNGRLESYRLFPSVYKMTFNVINGTLTLGFSDPVIYQADSANSIQTIGAYQDIDVYTGGEIEQTRSDIKEHIIKYGAVGAKLYKNENYYVYKTGGKIEEHKSYDSDGGWDRWYTKTYTPTEQPFYYCNQKAATPNTDVLIIGWNDEYQVPGAPGKGAYLVMDETKYHASFYQNYIDTYRWRNDVYEDGMYWSVSNPVTIDTNFYYVSYYDYYIESQVYGIKDFTTMRNGKEPYQWDKLGLSTVIEPENSGATAYAGNVWARNTDNPESLESISIANLESMKYEVYVNPKGSELSSDTLIKVAETDVLDPGYNTIYFDDTIMLTGKKFAVVVKYISPDKYGKTAKVGVQSPIRKTYKINGNNATPVMQNIQYFENATSAQGRSFIGSTLDSLTDMYNSSETKNMNVCIKAFTSEVPGYKVPTESIKIQKMSDLGIYEDITDSIQILKGDQAKLGIKISPTDGAYSDVNWTSSNKSIVAVDKDGTITANGAGIVTITAKLKNAPAILATCTVDVRVPIKSFTLNKSDVTILAGETNVLAGIIGPEDATTTKIEWTSSNKEVVKVTEDGLLIGLKQGTAIVTAVIRDESGLHTSTCKVTVPESLVVDVLGVSLNKSTLTLEKGTRETLKATVMPADATNSSVVWTSSNKNVAIVNANGRITALSPGTTTITVTTVSGGETATCTVTVTDVATITPTGITISQSSLTLEKDATAQLSATVTPSNANDKTVIWNSSDYNIVDVNSNGKITAIDTGTATITASTADGKYTAKCIVTVSKPTIKVTGITINKTAVTLEKDEKTQLIAGTQPSNADNANITWSSDNAQVAKVDDSGLVTAVGYGTATITAKTVDGGYTKTCVVYVPEKIAVTGIEISAETLEIYKDRTEKLTVNVLPKNADNTNITYKIEDETIATLSNNGVKGLKKGTTKITFTTEDGNFTKTCTITVKELDDSKIEISSNQYEIGQDGKIDNVNPNTTVKDFKEGLTTSKDVTIVIKDKDGNVLGDNDIVGTGSTIEISKEIEKIPEGQQEPVKETIKENFTIKITGDIDGNGKVTVTDLSQLKDYIMTGKGLDGIYYEAADINGDGKVTLTDLSLMKELLLNSEEEGK